MTWLEQFKQLIKHRESVIKQQFSDLIYLPRGGWPWTHQRDLALLSTTDGPKYRGDTVA